LAVLLVALVVIPFFAEKVQLIFAHIRSFADNYYVMKALAERWVLVGSTWITVYCCGLFCIWPFSILTCSKVK